MMPEKWKHRERTLNISPTRIIIIITPKAENFKQKRTRLKVHLHIEHYQLISSSGIIITKREANIIIGVMTKKYWKFYRFSSDSWVPETNPLISRRV
jgi:hypothetical protein